MSAAATARPETLSRFAARLSALVRLPVAMARRRRLLRELYGLDERMLRDIGLTRADVVSAEAEPLFRDASLVLAGRARDRRHAVSAAVRERFAMARLIRDWSPADRAA